MSELDKIVAIAKKYYQEWKENPSRMENGYQYESTFTDMTQKIGKAMLETSLGEIPKSRNDKKKRLQDLEK